MTFLKDYGTSSERDERKSDINKWDVSFDSDVTTSCKFIPLYSVFDMLIKKRISSLEKFSETYTNVEF